MEDILKMTVLELIETIDGIKTILKEVRIRVRNNPNSWISKNQVTYYCGILKTITQTLHLEED